MVPPCLNRGISVPRPAQVRNSRSMREGLDLHEDHEVIYRSMETMLPQAMDGVVGYGDIPQVAGYHFGPALCHLEGR